LNAAASNLLLGTYSAVIWFTNRADGVAQNRTFLLTIINPPVITAQPVSLAVIGGTTATFTSAASGTQMNCQWQHDGINITNGGRVSISQTTLTNATNLLDSVVSVLTISNLAATDAGIYALAASNAAGVVVSSNALLTLVPSAPIITQQPIDASVTVGNIARFTVSAVGTKRFFYQWTYDGTNLDGATDISLVLTNVQFSQAGTYAVVLTNVFGSIPSSNATLVVTPCSAAPAGLVSWWPGEGNGNDLAGLNPATPQSLVTYAPGEVHEAFQMNSFGAYLSVAASASLNAGPGAGLTVEAWISPTNVNGFHPIVEWNNGGTIGTHFWLGRAPTDVGLLYANLVDTSGNYHLVYSAQNAVAPNVFQHVALTYDHTSGVATLYMNGAVVAQSNLGIFVPQTGYPLWFGVRPGDSPGDSTYGSYLSGLLDELTLYSRALTPNEIQSIYNAGSDGKCFNPAPPTNTVSLVGCDAMVGGAGLKHLPSLPAL